MREFHKLTSAMIFVLGRALLIVHAIDSIPSRISSQVFGILLVPTERTTT